MCIRDRLAGSSPGIVSFTFDFIMTSFPREPGGVTVESFVEPCGWSHGRADWRYCPTRRLQPETSCPNQGCPEVAVSGSSMPSLLGPDRLREGMAGGVSALGATTVVPDRAGRMHGCGAPTGGTFVKSTGTARSRALSWLVFRIRNTYTVIAQ